MKISRLLSLVTVTVSFSISATVVAGDWPHFAGPYRLATSSETGLNLEWGDDAGAAPAVQWSLDLNEGFGGAAIVGDEVFFLDRILGETDQLRCVSLKDGSDLWKFEFTHEGRLSHPGSRGVPTVEEDAVYFTSGMSHVHRINRKTHEADWTVNISEKYNADSPKWGWAQSPLVIGDIVIAAAMGPEVGLVGLDKKTGAEVWTTEQIGHSHSSPTILTLGGVEQVLFVSRSFEGNDGSVISVDPRSGETLWHTDAYYNSIPIPFATRIDEQRVYMTGGYGCGSCMLKVTRDGDKWSVTKLWEIEQGTQMQAPFLIDDHLYFLMNENANHKGEARKTGGLACMDLEGNIVWQTGDDPFMGRGGSLLVDGKLLVQDGETGYLRVFEVSPKGPRQVGFADVFDKKAEVDEQIAKQEGRKTIKLPDFRFWSPLALSEGRLIMRGQTMMEMPGFALSQAAGNSRELRQDPATLSLPFHGQVVSCSSVCLLK